jgi:SPP1 family predicted phage head-tail adaptor
VRNLFCELELQVLNETVDNSADVIESYTKVADVFGSVDRINGTKGVEAMALQAGANTTVIIHYRDDVTPRHRFKYGNRYLYVIMPTDPKERHQQLICYCVEKV